jgi:hypothetical protein
VDNVKTVKNPVPSRKQKQLFYIFKSILTLIFFKISSGPIPNSSETSFTLPVSISKK